MSLADLIEPPDDDPYGRQSVEAIVVKAPADTGQLLTVTILSFADDDVRKVRWMPRGATLPAVGDYCLIAFTRDGTAWCPAWWPTTT